MANNPKAKSVAAAKIASSAERKRQREALVVTSGNWDRIHAENIRYGGLADPFALGELDEAKKALAEFDKFGKLDDTARKLSDAASEFFKYDKEVRECEARRIRRNREAGAQWLLLVPAPYR